MKKWLTYSDIFVIITAVAGVAQSVEQLIRNQQVVCSSHITSSILSQDAFVSWDFLSGSPRSRKASWGDLLHNSLAVILKIPYTFTCAEFDLCLVILFL